MIVAEVAAIVVVIVLAYLVGEHNFQNGHYCPRCASTNVLPHYDGWAECMDCGFKNYY